jgi:hypothetical protein
LPTARFETSSNWASSEVESAAFAAVAAVAANATTHVEKIKARLKLLLTAALLKPQLPSALARTSVVS